MAVEEGGRPKRAAAEGRVIYRECDSDDEDYETVVLLRRMVEAEKKAKLNNKMIPALNPLQAELRQICRLGDKEALKTFLANNPEINLDFREPDGGSTLLTEAVTKTAQFSDIVSLLIEAGADLTVRDSMGNTPLHNCVLYFPATMRTVDLLLARGADVSVKNNEGSTPLHLSDDKDLKFVMKELKRQQKTAATTGRRSKSKSRSFYSHKLRKLVCDLSSTGKSRERKIKVCYDKPNKVSSPGLLKRKRKREEEEEEEEEELNVLRTKRIRFSELDSAGNPIDPQFSDDEEDGNDDVDDNCTSAAVVSTVLDDLLNFVKRKGKKSKLCPR